MEVHLRIAGVITVALALMHVGFPRYFGWKADLSPLQAVNRQMVQVHTFFIGFTLLGIGVLCIASAHDLASTPLGRRISGGLAVFWALRLVFQHVVYSPDLWRGKRFETGVHLVFTFLWGYFTTVFSLAAGLAW